MGCIFYDYDYTQEMENKNFSITIISNIKIFILKNGDWGLGIGDWGLGIGDWAQSPIPNPQSPLNRKLFYKKLYIN